MDPSVSNPYQPPAATESPLESLPDQARAYDGSATRASRLGASLIDTVIGLVLLLPLQVYTGMYDGFPNISRPPFPQSLLWMLGGTAIWLALHGVFLARSAQTIGKKLVGIQIVNVSDGKRAPLSRLVLWRFLPSTLVSQLPYLGGVLSLVNILFIFRNDRRCIHDHIAGTRVVEVLASTR
ncbi:MAG: RDD family protein [Deltaproteobacteria bacterium]